VPPKINGFHEIAMVVTDLERSERFFIDMLGMEVLLRIPNQAVIMRMGDLPHHFIGLWLPNAHAAYQSESHGKMHFTMKINMADVDAWEAHFKAKNFHAPKRVKENGDVHFDFLDPDGNPLEFWARIDNTLSTMPGIQVPAESRNLFYNLNEDGIVAP
jgi:catechol 2,3-dioxygenase-like lactoylglutathione lyase family enzyme